MNTYPFVLVGGGPVGLLTLIALKKENIPAVVFDENSFDAPLGNDQRSLFLSAGTIRYLDKLGVTLSEGSPITQAHVFSSLSWGGFHLHASDCALPYLGYCINYSRFLKILRHFVALHYPDSIHAGMRFVRYDTKQEKFPLLYFTDSLSSPFVCRAEHVIITCRLPVTRLSVPTVRYYARLGSFSAERAAPSSAYEMILPSSVLACLSLSQDQPERMGFIEMTSEHPPSVCTVPDSSLCDYFGRVMGIHFGRVYDFKGMVTKEISIFYRHELLDSDRVLFMGASAQLFHPIGAQGINFSIFNIRALIHCMRQSRLWTDALASYARRNRSHRRFLWHATSFSSCYLTKSNRPFSVLGGLGLFLFNRSSFLKFSLQSLFYPRHRGEKDGF